MAVPPPVKYPPLHSITKVRLGAVPSVTVYMPCPAPVRSRSSQYAKMVGPNPAADKQTLVNVVLVVVNWKEPLEMAFPVV